MYGCGSSIMIIGAESEFGMPSSNTDEVWFIHFTIMSLEKAYDCIFLLASNQSRRTTKIKTSLKSDKPSQVIFYLRYTHYCSTHVTPNDPKGLQDHEP